MDNGYIKLHRKLLNWEWYKDINTKTLFIHCLLKANYQSKKWQGIEIDRGEFLTSLNNLAIESGLSKQQVRTSLNKLESTLDITSESNNQYRIITVKNYNDYQLNNTQSTRELTLQPTPTKKEKNLKKEKKKDFSKFSEWHHKFVNSFINKRKEMFPNSDYPKDKTSNNYYKWLNEIRLLEERIKDREFINKVTRHSQTKKFYYTNVRSIEKLRLRFDEIAEDCSNLKTVIKSEKLSDTDYKKQQKEQERLRNL